jgi:shikimate kinase
VENTNQLCLIGMMGSGKSSTGKMLSEKLGWNFIDIDQEIINKQNLSINELFSKSEIQFREFEYNEIKKYSSINNIVLAVGGGAVTFKKSYDLMTQMYCIYLNTSTNILADRLEHDSSRPLLKEKNKYEMLEKIFNQREELYRSLSSYEVNTDRNTLGDNCKKIMGLING